MADKPDTDAPGINGLTAQQVKTVAAILSTNTLKEAAEEAGVTTRAIWNWMRLPAFAHYLAESKRLILDTSAGRIVTLVGKAYDALEAVLDGDNVPAKVRAAAVVLNTAYNVSSLKDLEAQLLQLRIDREAAAAERAAELAAARETPLTPVPDATDAERDSGGPETGSGGLDDAP